MEPSRLEAAPTEFRLVFAVGCEDSDRARKARGLVRPGQVAIKAHGHDAQQSTATRRDTDTVREYLGQSILHQRRQLPHLMALRHGRIIARWSLAQFVKRVGWSEIRSNAVDGEEAEQVRAALEYLRDALAVAGFAPR